MSSGPAIGIDLGTTYTCVGVFQCGKVEIIANDQGYRRTPNYVAFTHRDCLIGDAAKNQLALNPVNTVFDAKRLIGLRFNDAEVQKDMKRWPFRVVNSRGKPVIQVEYCGEIKQFSPEEISSLVLRKAKETAEAYLGEEVKDAVITLPAYFNVSQRQATTYASELAGLNVLRTISEPMAAAIAYGLDKRLNRECNVLIFDLGRESLDVCILSIVNGTFEVKATDGDRHLGGKDFDSRLVDYYVKKFRRQLHGIHSVPSGRTISRLRRSCEAAKRTLSSTYYANVDVESLYEDLDFSTTLSRHFFEQVCMDLFNKLLSPVKRALSGAKLDRTDIDEIVLVGGSTHIPKVQKLLQDFFGGRKLNKSINPEEVVAYGAALLAADLTNSKSKILGVIPPPVGKNNEAAAPPLIKCSKSFPVKQTHTYTTRVDNQTSILIPVYASQRTMARDINLLCNFRLSGIPPAPRGMPQVEVTFDLDENGVLNVSAVEKSIKKQNSITISLETDCSLEDAEKRVLKQEDEKQKSRLVAKNMLENYVFTVISRMDNKEVKQKTSKEFRKNVYAMCGTTFKWLDTDCQATKEDYELMRKRIESICGPIMITGRPGQ